MAVAAVARRPAVACSSVPHSCCAASVSSAANEDLVAAVPGPG